MAKPLDGILVVSVEQAVAAPFCTSRLAEAGARVIKIERAEGDFARGYDTAAKGASSYFTWTNQGKESLTLDFHDSEDAALLGRIISQADVFIQNLAPGALRRAGFKMEDLREADPRLITVDISGYGADEAVSHLKAYDLLIQAEAGLTGISGGETELGRIGVSICDIGAGMTAHSAVLEAVLLRERTGDGAALSVSLFDVAADWMTVPLIHTEHGAGPPPRSGLKHPSIAPYGAFETQEGELTLISIQNDREWQVFCEDVLQMKNATKDPRFATNNARVRHRPSLESLISSVTLTLNQVEFQRRLSKAGIAYGGVNSVQDVAQHPALRRRVVETDTGDQLSIPALPVRWMDAPPSKTPAAAPTPGAHNSALREEFSQ